MPMIEMVTNVFGGTTEYIYKERNEVVKVIDFLGNETSYRYDVEDKIEEVCNPNRLKRHNAYNQSNKVTSTEKYQKK